MAKRGRPFNPTSTKMPVSALLSALSTDQAGSLARILNVKGSDAKLHRGRPRTMDTPVKVAVAIKALRKAKCGGAPKLLALVIPASVA